MGTDDSPPPIYTQTRSGLAAQPPPRGRARSYSRAWLGIPVYFTVSHLSRRQQRCKFRKVAGHVQL